MLKKILAWMKNYATFWKGDKEVPGVADSIRKTNLTKQHQERRIDQAELLRMVKENRLHEADERQLETLKLAMELNSLLGMA